MSYLTFRHSYYLTHPHEFVRETYLEIKWFIQRGRRGWADVDAWGFDNYLSHIIAEGARAIADKGMGYPIALCDDPYHDSYNHACKGDHGEEWREILHKIASGFEAWYKRDDWIGESEEWDKYQALPQAEAVAMATKRDKEAYDKLQESLELFKKYFVNLWD